MAMTLSITPVYLVISHNALYDAFFLLLYQVSLFFYFKYFQTTEFKHLILSAILSSLLVFVHGAGYPYAFFMWVTFPFFDSNKNRWRNWLYFSMFAGLLPLLQMIMWKFIIYGSFYPYQEMIHDWALMQDSVYTELFQVRHYLRFILLLVLGYTPMLFLSLLYFFIDIPWREKKYIVVICGTLLIIIGLLLSKFHIDFLYPLIIVFILVYMFLLKKSILRENKLLFFFGLMTIFTLSIYMRFFPKPYFHQKHFVYPVFFLIPIYWFYASKILKTEVKIFIAIIVAFFIQFCIDIYFQLPKNKNLAPPGFNVKYSSTFIFGLPFTNEGTQKELVNWYKQHNVKADDFIVTNLPGRYINALLNMPQNHYIKLIDSYTFKGGFKKPTLQNSMAIINKYNPKFIQWDYELHKSRYDQFDKSGERRYLFSFEDFDKNLFNKGYAPVDTVAEKYIIYSKVGFR